MEEIVSLRKKGLSGTEIGKKLGVSRQRIHQLLIHLPEEERKIFTRPKRRVYTKTCPICQKEFETIARVRVYCGLKCSSKKRLSNT